MNDLRNDVVRVKVENNDNEGCLFMIFLVLVFIFYQLCAIGQFIKENIKSPASAEQTQIEVSNE